MAYASWSVVFGEQPSAAKWNILGTNDASFNNGTGLPMFGSNAGVVLTGQTTTSTTYTDLATTGPTATAVVGSTGLLLVGIYGGVSNSAGNNSFIGFALSGANTLAVADDKVYTHFGTGQDNASFLYLATGLVAGSTVVTLKYRVTGGTGTFINRRVFAIPF